MIDGTWRDKLFSGYDVVFHVAGIAHVKETRKNRDLYYRINRDLAYETAKKAKAEGVGQFIFLSTMAVYPFKLEVIDYETKPNPYNHYGKSKLQAEKLLLPLECVSYKIAIIRPPIIYGPGCKGNFPRLQKFAKYAVVFPNIENKRSMLYVDNLCEFVKQTIDQEKCGLFFPQNLEYVSTQHIVSILRSIRKKTTIQFQLPKIVCVYVTKLSIFYKVFGDKVYTKQMSLGDYRVVDFDESLKRIENDE